MPRLFRLRLVVSVLLLALGQGSALAEDAETPLSRSAKQRAYHHQRAMGRSPAIKFSPYDWQVFAQAGAGRDKAASADAPALFGSLDTSADITFHSRFCELFVAGAYARLLAHPTGANLSAEQWASFCLVFAGGPAIEGGHHVEWQVTPALSAPLLAAAQTYSRETVRVGVSMYNIPFKSYLLQIGHSPWRIGFDLDGQGSTAPGMDLDRFRIEIALEMVKFVIYGPGGPDDSARHWRITGPTLYFRDSFEAVGRDVQRSATIGGGRLAQVQNAPLGPHLRADAGIEILGGTTVAAENNVATSNNVTTAGAAARIYGVLDLDTPDRHGVRAVLYGGAGFDRDMWATLEYDVVLEDRGSLWASLVGREDSVTVRGFLARTQVFTPTDVSGHVTGGGEITLDHDLGHDLAVLVQAEAARSFYARLDGQERPLPDWGLRAFAGLVWRRGGGRN